MVLVRLRKVKENNRISYRANFGQCTLVLYPDCRSTDLVLEVFPNDQRGLFDQPDPGEKGKAGDGS